MPLPKRVVEPVHVARGTVPQTNGLEDALGAVANELEAVTNGTLANAVRQLSSLSRHAEDMFGELTRDARNINMRASTLQARIDRLAVKVTQLDSTVEEVSLQDIHMRKAFRSQTQFDQQVVSRNTMPTAMLETYEVCDKPPPLDKLNPYREDGKDGMKFYTDPAYFFDLWRQEMLKDTERMIHDKGKNRMHRPRGDGGGERGSGGAGLQGRHKKRVRQPHNTRERQREMAVVQGEYIMPHSQYRTPQSVTNSSDGPHTPTSNDFTRPPRPSSIELRRTYHPTDPPPPPLDYTHQHYQIPPAAVNSHYDMMNHLPSAAGEYGNSAGAWQEYGYSTGKGMEYVDGVQSGAGGVMSPGRSGGRRPSQPPPAPPSGTNSANGTPTNISTTSTPTHRNRINSLTTTSRDHLPPPPPPPPVIQQPDLSQHTDELPPPPPPTQMAPPPPPLPPPPPMVNGVINGSGGSATSSVEMVRKVVGGNVAAAVGLAADPRNDLLKAIRDGIKLRKVEKCEQQQKEDRVNAYHDVASILARRVAVEFSDSDSAASDSEYDSDGWLDTQHPHSSASSSVTASGGGAPVTATASVGGLSGVSHA